MAESSPGKSGLNKKDVKTASPPTLPSAGGSEGGGGRGVGEQHSDLFSNSTFLYHQKHSHFSNSYPLLEYRASTLLLVSVKNGPIPPFVVFLFSPP